MFCIVLLMMALACSSSGGSCMPGPRPSPAGDQLVCLPRKVVGSPSFFPSNVCTFKKDLRYLGWLEATRGVGPCEECAEAAGEEEGYCRHYGQSCVFGQEGDA